MTNELAPLLRSSKSERLVIKPCWLILILLHFRSRTGKPKARFTIQQPTGVTLNHYGYQSDPNQDTNSLNGIGAFAFDSSPGSLIPLQSAALSSDVVQKYNLQPGQQFTITTANGPMTLTYADKTADWVQGKRGRLRSADGAG
jgi:hypothetical protein